MMNLRLDKESQSTSEQPDDRDTKRRTGNPSPAKNQPYEMATKEEERDYGCKENHG